MKVRNLIHHLLEMPLDADVESYNVNGQATDGADAVDREFTESLISVERVDEGSVVLGYTGPISTEG